MTPWLQWGRPPLGAWPRTWLRTVPAVGESLEASRRAYPAPLLPSPLLTSVPSLRRPVGLTTFGASQIKRAKSSCSERTGTKPERCTAPACRDQRSCNHHPLKKTPTPLVWLLCSTHHNGMGAPPPGALHGDVQASLCSSSPTGDDNLCYLCSSSLKGLQIRYLLSA